MMQANATSRAKMMNTMEGSDEKGDTVVVGELGEALSALKQAFQAAASAPAAGRLYELRGAHLGASTGVAAGKTLEDILTGFLHWCALDSTPGDGNFCSMHHPLETHAQYQLGRCHRLLSFSYVTQVSAPL